MEYRIGTGQKVLYFLVGAACAGGGVFLLINTLESWAPLRGADGLKLLGVAALWGAATLLYRDGSRLSVTIDESAKSLEIVTFNSSKKYFLDEIEGFRRGEKGIFRVYLKSGGQGVEIPQGIGNRDELIGWFSERYKDLDAVDLDSETKVLLGNEEFGMTEEDRAGRLAGAKRWDMVASAAAIGLFFWAMLYPKPYELAVQLLFIAPWVGVFATWKYRGLLKLYRKKNSPYPSVIWLMVFCSVGGMLRTILDYDLYGFSSHAFLLVSLGAVLAALVCIGACWRAIGNDGSKVVIVLCVFLVAAIYSFSAITFSNCYYDKSKSDVWNVKVLGKRVTHGKSTSYYLSLSSWGKYAEGREVTVGQSLFNRVSEQDVIHVYLHKGKWDMPWYWISD